MGGIYWLASYPKSGNTWFRAFLCNLRADQNAPIDINEIETGSIASARGWIDEVLGFDTSDLLADEVERLRPFVYQWCATYDEVSYHKIHDAYTFVAEGEPLVSREGTRGALYIVRNPLDVAHSLANHMSCSIDEAIARMGDESFRFSGRAAFFGQVRQRVGSWSSHVASWTECTDIDCEVIRYEDMLADPFATFSRAAHFLELPSDPDRLHKAIRFASFEELSRQEAAHGFVERPPNASAFFRRGTAGSWTEELTPAQVRRVIDDHGAMMSAHGYLDASGQPLEEAVHAVG